MVKTLRKSRRWRGDGSYIVFVLDETGNALTARWYDGSGTLRAEQSFTRGTPG